MTPESNTNFFSYHLIKIPFTLFVKGLFSSLISKKTKGLIYAVKMTPMQLGDPILSPFRYHIRQVAIFAQWKNEEALENFLKDDKFGKTLMSGWHLRLSLIRTWGSYSGYQTLENNLSKEKLPSPVVAVTIARIKPFSTLRFIRWGKPVEKLVRDHPGSNFSLASFRFPNTVSTFSIWNNEKEMTDMVHGINVLPNPKRHINAMKERERKDFHFEFTTLRFKPLSEYGKWNGKSNYISILKEKQE